MTEEITKALIFDTGSKYFKAGIAENDTPSTQCPTGYARDESGKMFFGNKARPLAMQTGL